MPPSNQRGCVRALLHCLLSGVVEGHPVQCTQSTPFLLRVWSMDQWHHYHTSCLVTKSCPTLCNPVDCSPQAPVSVGFFRQEYWSGLPFPSPGDLSHAGIGPMSPALQAYSLPLSHQGRSVSLGSLLEMQNLWLLCKPTEYESASLPDTLVICRHVNV